jgi:hypothetical protein
VPSIRGFNYSLRERVIGETCGLIRIVDEVPHFYIEIYALKLFFPNHNEYLFKNSLITIACFNFSGSASFNK